MELRTVSLVSKAMRIETGGTRIIGPKPYSLIELFIADLIRNRSSRAARARPIEGRVSPSAAPKRPVGYRPIVAAWPSWTVGRGRVRDD